MRLFRIPLRDMVGAGTLCVKRFVGDNLKKLWITHEPTQKVIKRAARVRAGNSQREETAICPGGRCYVILTLRNGLGAKQSLELRRWTFL